MNVYLYIFLHLLFLLVSLVLLSRLLGSILGWIVSLLTRYKVQVHSVNFLSLNQIRVTSPDDDFVLSITHVSVVSSLFTNSKRLFGIFIGDVSVKLLAVIPSLASPKPLVVTSTTVPKKPPFRVPPLVSYLIQRLHFSVETLKLHIQDTDDITLSVSLSTGANLVSYPDDNKFVSTHLIVDDIQIRMKNVSTTFLNTSFGFKLDLLLSTKTSNPLEHVTVTVKPLSIMVYEGLFNVVNQIQTRVKSASNSVGVVTKDKEHIITKLCKILPKLPKITKFTVDNVSCSISDIEETRNVSFKLARFTERGTHECTTVTEVLGVSKLELFINHTPCVSLSAVKIKNTISDISDSGCHVTMATLVEVLKLQWFNTELLMWISSLPSSNKEYSMTSQNYTPLVHSTPNITIATVTELIDCSVNLYEDNVSHKKIISLGVPQLKYHHRKTKECTSVGMECRTLQLGLPLQKHNIKQKIKGVTNTHIWGELVFVKACTVKLRRYANKLDVNIDVRNVVLEWSYHLSDLIMELMPQLLTIIPPRLTKTTVVKHIPIQINLDSKIEKLNLFLLADDPGEVCTLLHINKITLLKSSKCNSAVMEDIYLQLLEDIPQLYLCNIDLDPADMFLSIQSTSVTNQVSAEVSAKVSDVVMYWDPTQHRVLETCVRKTKASLLCIRDLLMYKRGAEVQSEGPPAPPLNLQITINSTAINCTTAPTNQITLQLTPCEITLAHSLISIQIPDSFSLIMDSHQILHIKDIELTQVVEDDELLKARSLNSTLEEHNKAWYFKADEFKVFFPYHYQDGGGTVAMAVDEAQNCFKMLKALHRTPRLASDGEPLYADCRVVIKLIVVEFEDFDFDQKISQNYMIMRQARIVTTQLNNEEQEMETGDLNLSALADNKAQDTIWDTYFHFQTQIQAEQAGSEPVSVFTLLISDIDICVCTDESMNGHDNVVELINQLDSDTEVPPDLRFTTLWARWVYGKATQFYMTLRDFPSELWNMNKINIKGVVCGAEAVSPNHSIRKTVVLLRRPWKNFELARGMNSQKFFYNLELGMQNTEMSWGPCLEPTYQFFGQCLDKITKKSRDPSPLLPFWDKTRLMFRGDIVLTADLFTLKLLSEQEPCNKAEYLCLCSKGFIFKWTNGNLHFEGDTEIKNNTESKYGECQIVSLPHLNITVLMVWKVPNNLPNDHWAVTPHEAKYAKCNENEIWDSYNLFRSKWLDLNISLHFDKADSCPKVNVYSHTFKWLGSWAKVFATVSRPVFKGRYWNNLKSPKKKLARHYRKIHFNTEFEFAELEIWSSYRKRAGARLTVESGKLQMTQKLTLVPWDPIEIIDEDGEYQDIYLKRRPKTVWSTESCSAFVNNILGTLKGSLENLSDTDFGRDSSERSPEHFLMSIHHVEYRHRDDKTGSSDSLHSNNSRDSKLYTHWINISNVKASLNIDTRTLILAFLEQYESSRALSCDLSAEALRVVNLETNSSSFRSPRNSKLERSPNQSNDDLLSQWDEDTVTIVTVDDRTHASRDKLAGEEACSDHDIKTRKWSIQMTNGQIALQGPELNGFTILTTGKCQVLGSEHKPVLRGGEFFSKFSWVCIVEHVQYFATVDEAPDCSIPWLDENIINVKTKRTNSSCGELSSDSLFSEEAVEESLKSIVREVYRNDSKDSVTQLQRIVSRCGCLLSFATYGSQPIEDPHTSTDDLRFTQNQFSSELLSAFSLRHKNLEVATNSHQYKMIIDCVNNLILRTEASKRSSKARLQHAIRLMESGQAKARENILELQDKVRELLRMIKDSERMLYELRETEDSPQKEHATMTLVSLKQQLTKYRVLLRLTISAFKEYITITDVIQQSESEDQVEVRKSDICIDEANWTLTGECGQIPIMEVTIRENFLYSRTVYNTSSEYNLDFSSGHKITLGYFSVKNRQHKCEYRDVLFPKSQGEEPSEDGGNRNARLCLRVFLSQKHQPVGGININDHLEINLVPLVLNFETLFWKEIQKFFLGKVRPDADELDYDELDDTSSIHPLNFEQRATKSGKKYKGFGSKKNVRSPNPNKAIDEMAARSAKIFFNFVKIQEIPILISYKGGRISVREKTVHFPKIEITERVYTWKELCLEIKKISAPKIALSLGKISKQRYYNTPALSLLDKDSGNNANIDEQGRDEAFYRLLTGPTGGAPSKKKKGISFRKKSKKTEKILPQRSVNVPNESFAKECDVPGEWQGNTLGEQINELAAISDEASLHSIENDNAQDDIENTGSVDTENENPINIENQLG